MHAPLEIEAVREQMERLLRSGVCDLSFPAQLEEQFESDQGSQRAHRLWREGLISIVAFCGFYVAQWALTRQLSAVELIVQMGLITPLCLLVNALMRMNPRESLREGSVAATSCVIAWTYLYLQQGKGAVTVAFTLVGVIVTAMFAAVVMRLRFRYATGACVLIGLAGHLFLLQNHALRFEEKLTGAALMSIAIGIAVMSNFSLEREERLGYLRFLESEAQRRELADKNAQLARLSALDKLTGLPNRRTYEDRLAEIWENAIREGTAVSLIVLDIDHFKVLNDVRGHLYGDDVLRRVGGLLPQVLRSTEDLVARYGGEEFVVVLPRTDREGAERIAERIRGLVEMVAVAPQAPHPRLECLMWVTASLGVSTVVPYAGMKAEELLESADKALYRAKEGGRNRSMFRSMETDHAVTRVGEPRVRVEGFVA